MKRTLLFITLTLLAIISYGQSPDEYFITARYLLETRNYLVIDGDTFSTTTQVDLNDTTIATKQFVIDATGASGFDSITFNQNADVTYFTPYTFKPDTANRTVSMTNDESEIKMQLGQELWLEIKNDNGSTFINGVFVYITGSAEGHPTVMLAHNRDFETIDAVGMITHDVEAGTFGFTATFGSVGGLVTTGETAGAKVYIDTLSGGKNWTTTIPEFPNFNYEMGFIQVVDGTDGKIFINPKGRVDDILDNQNNSNIVENFSFTCASDGITITGTLESTDGKDYLTVRWSDGFAKISVPATVTIPAGTDNHSQVSYVYIPKSTEILTASTSYFPIGTEYKTISKTNTWSIVSTQTRGLKGLQNYNDYVASVSSFRGRIAQIGNWQRLRSLKYINGSIGSLSITTNPAAPDNVYFEVTQGNWSQANEQVLPSMDMSLGHGIHVLNYPGHTDTVIADLNEILIDANGVSLAGRSFKYVFWIVQNKTGTDHHLYVNLPNESYSSGALAEDADGVTEIPYDMRSHSGFVTEAVLTHTNPGSGTWTLYSTTQTQGNEPGYAGGGGSSGTAGTFDDLTDTPASKSGEAGSFVTVHSGETDLEYTAKSAIPLSDFSNDLISGTTNYVSKFTSSNVIGNSIIYDDGTNIGLGTTSPDRLLHLFNGHILLQDDGDVTGNEVNLDFKLSSGAINATARIAGIRMGAGALTDIVFSTFDTNLFERMRIQYDGNIGIGVSDSDTRLEILNAGNQLKLSFDGTDNTIFGVDTNGDLTITPSGGDVSLSSSTLTIGTIANETTDVDKFLVSNAGLIKYRTGAEVLSDIGATSATNLSLGIITSTIIDVNSDTGTNATLLEANTTQAGILGSDKWDEIVANSLKATNVTTDLSVTGTSSPLTLNSSDGTDVTFTAGTNITLAGTSSNITINATGGLSDSLTATYVPRALTSTTLENSGIIDLSDATAINISSLEYIGIGTTPGRRLDVLHSHSTIPTARFQNTDANGRTVEIKGSSLSDLLFMEDESGNDRFSFMGSGEFFANDLDLLSTSYNLFYDPTSNEITYAAVAGGGDALTSNPLSQFASTTSLQLDGVISDDTGSGSLVFGTSPTLVTPALGTPSTLVGTNISGTASGLTAGTVTTNANLTGIVTSVGNATAIANKAIAISKLADGTDGQLITWDATGVIDVVATGTANQVLTSNGIGTAPTFQTSSTGAPVDARYITQTQNATLTNEQALSLLSTGFMKSTISTGVITTQSLIALGSDVSGNLSVDHLDAGTSASASTFWRGDGAWATPSGGGNVSTSGTPALNDFAKFVNATDIEGRTYAETKTDLSLNLVENTALSTWTGSTNIASVGSITVGNWNAGIIPAIYGGTSFGSYTAGDLLYANTTTTLTKRGIGSPGQVLTSTGGVPTWETPSSGFADPMTTIGDIIIKNATNVTTRLGIGTNGQVLESDGTNISWQTPYGIEHFIEDNKVFEYELRFTPPSIFYSGAQSFGSSLVESEKYIIGIFNDSDGGDYLDNIVLRYNKGTQRIDTVQITTTNSYYNDSHKLPGAIITKEGTLLIAIEQLPGTSNHNGPISIFRWTDLDDLETYTQTTVGNSSTERLGYPFLFEVGDDVFLEARRYSTTPPYRSYSKSINDGSTWGTVTDYIDYGDSDYWIYSGQARNNTKNRDAAILAITPSNDENSYNCYQYVTFLRTDFSTWYELDGTSLGSTVTGSELEGALSWGNATKNTSLYFTRTFKIFDDEIWSIGSIGTRAGSTNVTSMQIFKVNVNTGTVTSGSTFDDKFSATSLLDGLLFKFGNDIYYKQIYSGDIYYYKFDSDMDGMTLIQTETGDYNSFVSTNIYNDLHMDYDETTGILRVYRF